MNRKSKHSGWVQRFFLRCLGAKNTKNVLASGIKKREKTTPFAFPIHFNEIKRVLFVLPDDYMEVLHQYQNLLSLVSLFREPQITILCETKIVPYISILPDASIQKYSSDECKLFSSTIRALGQKFQKAFDICFYLPKTYNLPLLHLIGSSQTPIRVGYRDAGEYPFLNIRIVPSELHSYIPEYNGCMARLFGARTKKKIRWAITKETVEKIDYYLKESNLSSRLRLLGIDVLTLSRTFGQNWTKALVQHLVDTYGTMIYGYTTEPPDISESTWIKTLPVPVLSKLSLSSTAAIFSRSVLVLAGISVSFALTNVLGEKVIVLLAQKDLKKYCPPGSSQCTPVVLQKSPDTETIDQIITTINKVYPSLSSGMKNL